jgi:DNA-binding response OmpR family regulator
LGDITETPVVLIADDDTQILDLITEHFESFDCELLTATDGEQALEMALEHHPDLVLLDVMMPGLNGWEVCKYLREHEGFEKTGVIMLTAIGETVNEVTSPLYGADDHVDKPFSFAELEFKVKRVISERRRGVAGGSV